MVDAMQPKMLVKARIQLLAATSEELSKHTENPQQSVASYKTADEVAQVHNRRS
jgi:hypothetical protein